jgi:hypothetical protein
MPDEKAMPGEETTPDGTAMRDEKVVPDQKKDAWERLDIILKPLGGILTALAVGLVGYYGSQALNRSQALDTDVRLYAQLMSQREDAETSLRKDMFNSIIGTFLTSKKKTGYEEKVLNLELLAYNFHEALDLAPLFKTVYRQIDTSPKSPANDYLLHRLEQAADEVKSKQIAALEDAGGKLDTTLDLDELASKPEGMKLIDGTINFRSNGADKIDPALQKIHFNVEALFVDRDKRQIRVKLEVKTPRNQNGDSKSTETDTSYSVFWISPFDFPMIDNTRLPYGQRCAIVLRKFGNPTAQLTLVYFPGSRASLKEKPFFDEAMRDLLHTRSLIGEETVK